MTLLDVLRVDLRGKIMTLRLLFFALLFACSCSSCPVRTPAQAKRQAISRAMAVCIGQPMAQEYNGMALDCTCQAERACLAAGLDRRCAWEDWQLETAGAYPVVVGKCVGP